MASISPERPPSAAMDALGSDVRRAILLQLAHGPLAVGDIAGAHPISRPAISKHLRILQGAGLISHSSSGKRNLYRLEQAGFEAAREWLDQFWPDALARFKMVAENLDEERHDD